MGIYWEDATKRLQEEIGDPYVWVEFDPKTQEYEILKNMPGGWDFVECFGMKYYYQTEYAEVQMSFKEWDNRVFEEMRRGAPHNIDVKIRRYERNEMRRKIDLKRQEHIEEIGREIGKDFWRVSNPSFFMPGGKAVN